VYGRLGVRASTPHPAVHLSHRSNWLRAAVLGANDGIVSTLSVDRRDAMATLETEPLKPPEIAQCLGVSRSWAHLAD
jgi:hypothetical protein